MCPSVSAAQLSAVNSKSACQRIISRVFYIKKQQCQQSSLRFVRHCVVNHEKLPRDYSLRENNAFQLVKESLFYLAYRCDYSVHASRCCNLIVAGCTS